MTTNTLPRRNLVMRIVNIFLFLTVFYLLVWLVYRRKNA